MSIEMMEYINQLLGVDFTKTKNAVKSCQTRDQLRAAKNMIELYKQKNSSMVHQYDLLLQYYVSKKNEFMPVKVNQEIHAL